MKIKSVYFEDMERAESATPLQQAQQHSVVKPTKKRGGITMNHQGIPVGDEQLPNPIPRVRRMTVYHIVEREGIDPVWTKVGVAFVNRDGSLNLFLDLIPINGRLHVRDRQVKTPQK